MLGIVVSFGVCDLVGGVLVLVFPGFLLICVRFGVIRLGCLILICFDYLFIWLCLIVLLVVLVCCICIGILLLLYGGYLLLCDLRWVSCVLVLIVAR